MYEPTKEHLWLRELHSLLQAEAGSNTSQTDFTSLDPQSD